jgi:hypothetical protein
MNHQTIICAFLLFFLNAISFIDGDETCENSFSRPSPEVILHGKRTIIDDANFAKHLDATYPPSNINSNNNQDKHDGLEYYILNEQKRVLYIPNFLETSTIQALQEICQGRFVDSPVRRDTDASTDQSIRTSESCTMVPAAVYRNNEKYIAMIESLATSPNPQVEAIQREVNLSWSIGTRVSQFLGISDPSVVEALQLVRYTSPRAQYRVHHDHGAYYQKSQEHRPWTVLIILQAPEEGGYTSFPKLDLQIIPRAGDAIVWSNVHPDGSVDPDMVHAGEPPLKGKKVAMNVWVGEQSVEQRLKQSSSASSKGSQWS